MTHLLILFIVGCLLPVLIITHDIKCDILVVGDSESSVAAAHEAVMSFNGTVCVISKERPLGGQMTTQAVSAFDESFVDFSETYSSVRHSIRVAYVNEYHPSLTTLYSGFDGSLNPGACWVSRMCFDPRVAQHTLDTLLSPYLASGSIQHFSGYSPQKALLDSQSLKGIVFASETGDVLTAFATVVIDATDLGDILPLLGVPFLTGQEPHSAFGEPDAPLQGSDDCVQPFTYGFYLELRPSSEDHRINMPLGYNSSLYGLNTFKGFFFNSQSPWMPERFGFNESFWTYRRVFSAAQYPDSGLNDVALINWNPGNDFDSGCGLDGCNLIGRDQTVQQRILEQGKLHALGFLYFLQNDVPRDDGSGTGYPNLMLRPDITGTSDGLSLLPYIREGRRVHAVTQVVQQDIASANQDSQEYRYFRSVRYYGDSVGIGRYELDIHPAPTCQPFQITVHPGAAQIPLGSLIPAYIDNLIMGGGKNFGGTHISQGMYRTHACEWNIGQAAGAAAAISVQRSVLPRQVLSLENHLRALQYNLVAGRGGPIFWWRDGASVHAIDPHNDLTKRSDFALYVAAQMLAVAGVLVPDNKEPIVFGVSDPVPANIASQWLSNLFNIQVEVSSFANNVTRAEFLASLLAGYCNTTTEQCPPPLFSTNMFADVPLGDQRRSVIEGVFKFGFMADELSDLSPLSDIGKIDFQPDALVTKRSAAIWMWNVLRKRWDL